MIAKLLAIAVVLALSACSGAPKYDFAADTANMIKEAASDPATTYTIHKPARGCPKGWQLRPKTFTERDGTTMDACTRLGTAGESMGGIDVLLPGESIDLTLPVPEPNDSGPTGVES